MADISLHFTNRRGEETIAHVRRPLEIHFTEAGQKLKAVVGKDADVNAIFLNPKGMTSTINKMPDGVDIVTDDAAETERDGFGPGVCYETKNGQIFCW